MEVSQTMLNVGACVLAGVIAYLLGSISFAIIVSRIYAHDDVRKYGSKNAGMTNILRTYGKMPAFFTLLGDFLKGVLAVVIGRWIFSIFGAAGSAKSAKRTPPTALVSWSSRPLGFPK